MTLSSYGVLPFIRLGLGLVCLGASWVQSQVWFRFWFLLMCWLRLVLGLRCSGERVAIRAKVLLRQLR